jgi:hypothetical protein
MSDVKDGEVYVAGPTRRNAQALLAAARGKGLPETVVRATSGGFIVPASLVEPPAKKKPAARRKTTKKSAQGKEGN